MPGKVKVKIIAGRNLPVMDRSSDTTDAYVEIKLGNTTYKTDVCRKSLNPQWNSEWYRFEVDDSELQDEPLQIRLMDHDTYSANDAIGKVYLNLNPLLLPSAAVPGKYTWGGDTNIDQPSSSVLSGWIPVYDTMHGIRGEVNVTVKVELFSDFNKFRQSSCGVQFFCSPVIPHGFHAQVIHGFIEELVVNDDPEYQWIDKIRTPRASNEARQTLFFKLSGELQRKIGVKALDLGGNAVIGYNQCFDLEGESGIVARGIGTVVTLIKHHEMQQQMDISIAEEKALSYLKFLAFDNGLKLDNDNIFERFTLSSSNPNSIVSVSIPDYPKEPYQKKTALFLRQSSQPLIEYEPLPSNLKTSFSSRSLTDDIKKEIALRHLLRQEEVRGSSAGLTSKIKYLKHNMLQKRSSLKTKSDSSELDNVSISSRGESSSFKTSLIDLRELRKKKKQSSQNSHMAQLLVRSVMNAYTSLDCIAECHDSGPPHSSEEAEEGTIQNIETHKIDLEVNPTGLNKTISEPYLLLPEDTAIVTPTSNASSESELSSSDGSDSPSENKDKIDFDTVSLIVKNVQNEQKAEHELELTYFKVNIQNESEKMLPMTAPALHINDNNLFLFPLDMEKKIDQLEKSEVLKMPQKHVQLIRTISRSCTDIAEDNEMENVKCNINIVLPQDMEKRIANLRHSALFKSITIPKSMSHKTFSISHEDLFNTDNLTPNIETVSSDHKRRKSISLSDLSQISEIENSNVDIAPPKNMEKRIANLRHSALFKSITIPKSMAHKTFSISHEDISNTDNLTPNKETVPLDHKRRMSISLSDLSQISEIENGNVDIALPKNMEKRIADLRHSALFKSIVERPKTYINKTYSISHDDITNNFENIIPATQIKDHDRKRRMSKAYSISSEEIYSPNLAEIETRIDKLRESSVPKKPEMRRRGKLQRTFSVSYDDMDQEIDNTKIVMPIDLEKRIAKLIKSPVFSVKKLSKSCEDLHLEEDKKTALSQNIEKKLHTFINSPLFKFSVKEQKPETKLNKQLSKSHSDISITKKESIESNSRSQPDLTDLPTAMHAILQEKINILTSQPVPISPRAKEQLFSEINQDLGNDSLIKTAMQTILMEKIDLMTAQNAPVSTRVREEFPKSISKSSSKSDPDIREDFISSLSKLPIFPKSPSFLRKHRCTTGSLQYTPSKRLSDAKEHNSVKSLIMDKIHLITTRSPPNSPTQSEVNSNSLVKTAMQTILMEKVNILTPPISSPTENKFEYDYEEPRTKSEEKIHTNISSKDEIKDHTLTKTAMQTMLLDNINLMSSGTPPISPVPEEQPTTPKSPKLSGLDRIKTTVHHVFDKVHILSPKHTEKPFFNDNSEPSLMKTAMQTMLIDKVNIVAPDSVPLAVQEDFNEEEKHPHKPDLPALDTVKSAVSSVIDKVTNLSPTSPKHEKNFDFSSQGQPEPSLMTTAMQTMLIDKVNILAPEAEHVSAEEAENLNKDKVQNLSSSVKDTRFEYEKEDSLMKTAMQTMLIDKVNIIAPSNVSVASLEEPIFEANVPHSTPEPVSEDDDENQSLIKTAMTAMLMEKVNIVASTTATPAVAANTKEEACSSKNKKHSLFQTIKKKCKSLKPKNPFSKFMHKTPKTPSENEGMVESAMNTILMDRVNNIQGMLNSSDEQSEKPSPNPVEPPPKACSKEKLNEITSSPEEPNIAIRLDTGDSCNRGTAITAGDANCNTNAEHAPCLYTSDRRIVESPVPSTEREREKEPVRERHGHQRTESTGGKMSQSPARLNAIPCIHRRSSDSDLSITPKGNSLTGSDRSGGTIPGYHHIRSTLLRPTVDNFDMMEYPFLTMAKYPPGFILHLGGAVSARSVKLLERITNIEEPETRDTWWSEIRMEIRTHARALNCNAVLGYTESTSICDEVCVLSASGTAAVIAIYNGEITDAITGLPNLPKPHIPNKDLMTTSLDRTDFERDKNTKHTEPPTTSSKITQVTESPEHEATIEFSGTAQTPVSSCRICHIPYSESSMSFRINMLYCSVCKMAKVPDILLTTIEMPEGLPITGRGCFLQSYVCRPKRDLKGELNAKEISESLPFLEYELHRLLVNKMKVKAMNTIFGLKVRITIGERMLVGVATGTAVFLLPLPPPPLPKLIAGNATTEDKKIAEMQKLLVDTVKKNKEIYELKDTDIVQPIKLISDAEESDDEKSNLDLGSGNKDSCVLEVDDSEDIEVINLLVEPRPPDGFHVVNTENVPGLEDLEIVKNLQMFTQVWRSKIPINQSASHFGKHFQKLLQSVYFKLRRMIPCALCDLQFRVDLPEPDEIQLTLLGMALGLGDPLKLNKFKRKCHLPSKEISKKSDDEMIFSLEEDHIPENSIPVINQSSLLNPQLLKHRQKSPQRPRINPKQRHTPIKERHGVDITPLSYVPGGKIERYLGYLNFFFIRETTSIREGGGLSGFVHSFITEVLAIVRAHVTALGGNAMVSYFMTECVLYHNAHKNQGQCLINVGGDVVFVSYFTEDN